MSLKIHLTNLQSDLYYIYWVIRTFHLRWRFPNYNIMSIEETVDDIIINRKSISRYGDGEFILVLKERGILFQSLNEDLSDRLKLVLNSNLPNLIVALPEPFKNVKSLRRSGKIHWLNLINQKGNKIACSIKDKKKVYGNAFISRFYMEYDNKRNVQNTAEKIKEIWENKDLLIIEGESSRLGIGNDLFENAQSISRIICPADNAYAKYQEILASALKYGQDKLIIIALGPTATVLAHDLAKVDFWALDLGHIDVEYMWHLMKVTEKVKLHGKKSAEVGEIKNIPIPDEFREEYVNSIVLDLK